MKIIRSKKQNGWTTIWVFLFSAAFLSCPALAIAQQASNLKVEVPEGMELKEISAGYQVLVPKGIKMEMDGNQVKIESSREYFLRRFEEVEKRLKQLEENQKELQKLLEELKGAGVEQLKQGQEQLSQEIQNLKEEVTDLPRNGEKTAENP
jgi:DNA repair exonuclease SbcCD ATPase subunit